MPHIASSFGISSFGYGLGKKQSVEQTAREYVDNPEMVMQWGCETYYRAAENVFAVDLAATAAREAIDRAKITPNDVDLVVFASSDLPEYTYWDSSTALARELGIKRTQTMLLSNEGCASGIRVFGNIAGVLAIQPDIQTVLLAVVHRNSEHHRNRMQIVNSVLSDGAVAVVLKRGLNNNQWLATDHFAYPEYCDLLRNNYGGVKAPLPPEGWTNRDEPGYLSITKHFNNDLTRIQNFLLERNALVIENIDQVCARAGVFKNDIVHLIYTNDSRPGAIEAISTSLGISLKRTNFELSRIYGHMGAVDQLFCLGKQIESGELKEGDLVVLSGISTGMLWCSTLFRI